MDNFNKTDDLYDPNFSIDSSNTEKLDMYGVWLKKKKNAAESVDTDISETISDSDLEEEQDAAGFDDNFSFADSFADLDADGDISEFNELEGTKTEKQAVEVPLETSSSGVESSEISLDEENFESLDLDDFLSEDDTKEAEHQEASDTFVEEEPIDLDFAEIADDTATPADDDVPPAGLENFSEISLEDFEDAAPADAGESADDFETVDDFEDILTDDEPRERKTNDNRQQEESSLDITVSVDDDTNKIQPLMEASGQIVEDNADISIFGTNGDKPPAAAQEPAFFDDIEAVKQDLLSTQQSTEQEKGTMDTTTTTSKQSAAEQDKATELLMKIAHEISDLKAELNSLKAGIAAQTNTAAEAPSKPDVSVQDSKPASTESSGFFSDDDTDETIALTGDELNNILITADFTEERNSEEEQNAAAAQSAASEDYEAPPVLPKEIASDVKATADSDFEASIAEPESTQASDAHKSGEKLLAADPVFNVEPAPITSLPEDLSYLDDESEVTDNDIELVDGVGSSKKTKTVEDAEPVEDETAFEDINIESFDIPSEQEIEVPEQNNVSVTQEVGNSRQHTIHELQTDDDFNNPFDDSSDIQALGDEDEVIEEPFTDKAQSEEAIEELAAISDPDTEDKDSAKQETLLQAASKKREQISSIPLELKNEIKSVLSYMDQLLEALPEKKIEEFAKSEYFETYKHLFEELGIS